MTSGATLCTVGLLDAALASSASRHGSTVSADMSPAAIIEPATGREARGVLAASVRAPTCMIADALTKVVMIQGTGAAAVLTRYGADALMMMADGAMLATTDWDRMQLHAA